MSYTKDAVYAAEYEKRKQAVMKKFRLSQSTFRELKENYTISEIEHGEYVNGKFVPLNLILAGTNI